MVSSIFSWYNRYVKPTLNPVDSKLVLIIRQKSLAEAKLFCRSKATGVKMDKAPPVCFM